MLFLLGLVKRWFNGNGDPPDVEVKLATVLVAVLAVVIEALAMV